MGRIIDEKKRLLETPPKEIETCYSPAGWLALPCLCQAAEEAGDEIREKGACTSCGWASPSEP